MKLHFYIYILQCSDGSYYVGHTDDLDKRLHEHQHKLFAGYTAQRLPIKLVYSELFYDREDAFVVERKLKNWSRKKKEILIKYGWEGFVKKKKK